MRYIDELLALYPGKDAATRKFILAQILDHPADDFSGEIVDRLWAETRSSDSIVRRKARLVLGRFLPAHTAFSYRLIPERPGLWTASFREALAVAEPEQMDIEDAQNSPEGQQLAAGAAACLAGTLDQVTAVMFERGTPLERAAGSFVLGRLNTPKIVEALVAQVSGVAQPSYQAAFALAEVGDEAAVEGLLRCVREHGRAKPDLYMLLGGVPCRGARACLDEEEPAAGPAGRANIAFALAEYGATDVRPLLERLVKRREGWVTAYALNALAGHGDPEDLPLMRLAWEGETHEFIRAQAVRAAATVRSPAARDFCLEALRSGAGRIPSVALEALAAQDVPPDQLAELARPLLASESLRTRVRAILVVARHDPDAVVPEVERMVLDQEALFRLEGAFIIGYVRGLGSRQLLERMTECDRSAAVRVQAIKSLGRYPAAEVLPALSRLFRSDRAPLVEAACRAALALPEHPTAVMDELLAAAAQAAGPEQRALLWRAAGVAARAVNRPPPPALIDALGDPDPVVKLGALDGLRPHGDAIPVEPVMPLLAHADPRVQARAALVALLAGHPEHTGVLTSLLTAGQEAASMEALRVLLEVGLVVPHLARGRFRKLAAKLGVRAPAPAPPAPLEIAPAPPVRRDTSTRRVPSLRKPEVLRALAQGAASPGTSSRDLGGLAGDYAKKAAGEPASISSSGLVISLAPGATPLAAVAPDTDDLSGVRPLMPLRKPSRALPSRPVDAVPAARFPTPLVAAAVVLLGVFGLVVARLAGPAGGSAPAPSGSPLAPDARRASLKVWSVRGPCSAKVGEFPAAGELVSTGNGASLLLKSGQEVSVKMGAVSELRMGAPAPGPVLEQPAGEVSVETRTVEVQVKLGSSLYRMRSGHARITAKGDGWLVEQLGGDGTVVGAGGDRRVLVVGQTANVAHT